MDLQQFIRAVPDFPTDGILFRDITPLLNHVDAFNFVTESLEKALLPLQPEAIVAVESRGFIFGAALAQRARLPLALVRKPGKLPAKKFSVSYSLEYGSGQLEIHQDALTRGQKVVIIDDLLATGGTAHAADQLVQKCGATTLSYLFVIELLSLHGRNRLDGHNVFSLLQYE